MVTITIEGVPVEVRDELSRRAARVGRSLSDYLRSELIGQASPADREAVLARMTARVEHEHVCLTVEEILGATDSDRR
jgi:hypothetical protein